MRKWLLIPVVVLVLAVGLPRPAGATAPTEYHATYIVKPASVTVTSHRSAGGNEFTSYTYQARLAGDITGPVTATEDDVTHADGTQPFHGMFTCACTVAGHSGTLIMKYVGIEYLLHVNIRRTRVTRSAVAGFDVIVRGTGGLANLHGQGTFLGTEGRVTKDLFLHFGPS
jgi:hypothetical protein